MDWLGENAWPAGWPARRCSAVAEMFSLDLILLMLAVGALAGMVTALLGAPVGLQFLIAAGTSVAMLALVRPSLAKRLHTGPELRLGHGKLVGKQGLVTETDHRARTRPDPARRGDLVRRSRTTRP